MWARRTRALAQFTHWVDAAALSAPPGTGCGTDAGYMTIQAAVDVALAGDTIIVCAGTYVENVTIPPLTAINLMISGANAGNSAHPDNPTPRGAESIIVGQVSIGVPQGSENITFDGFTVQSGTASGAVTRGLNVTIANTIFEGELPFPTSGTRSGIVIGDTSAPPQPMSFNFVGNHITGYRFGLNLDGSASASGVPSVASGNYIANNERGIQTQGSMHGGMVVHEITGNTIEANANGIRLAGGGFVVSGNDILENTAFGIRAGAGTVSMDDLAINFNCIEGNAFGLDNASGLAGSINAIQNWWGDASGPTHATNLGGTGDAVSDNVDFDPFLTVRPQCGPAPDVMQADIDIKPGSDPNSINPLSRGTIPVAILSTAGFDAPAEVDRTSLTFGRTGDEESLHMRGRPGMQVPNCGVEDVNSDDLLDLVCHFNTQDTEFQCDDTEGILRGTLLDTTPIEGTDAVMIVPCN